MSIKGANKSLIKILEMSGILKIISVEEIKQTM